MKSGYKKWSSLEKLFDNTVLVGECMEWQGPYKLDGNFLYGKIRYGVGPQTGAHRIAYAFNRGIYERSEIDTLDCVLHSCDNPPCINPAHLREGDRIDNGNDAKIRNRMERGGQKHNSVLNESMVKEIKKMLNDGVSVSSTAKNLNLSYKRVWDVDRGRCWEWVK